MEKTVYILTKISDDKFDGHHPNNILEGMYWLGTYSKKPKVVIGERFHFGTISDHPREHLRTSTVISTDGEIFKTNNSTYKIEKYEKNNI